MDEQLPLSISNIPNPPIMGHCPVSFQPRRVKKLSRPCTGFSSDDMLLKRFSGFRQFSALKPSGGFPIMGHYVPARLVGVPIWGTSKDTDMTGKKIKIGCASGFWGDSNISTPQLVASKELDYLVFDYLAEITMSIMARQRASHPERGYAHDFVSKVMRGVLPAIAAQGIRVVSNPVGRPSRPSSRSLGWI